MVLSCGKNVNTTTPFRSITGCSISKWNQIQSTPPFLDIHLLNIKNISEMKNRNHFLIATSSVVCIAIALTCIFFVPSNKGETLTLNTSLLKDFDWSDTLELSNIYSSVRFLPVSVSKNIRDIEIFDDNALFLAFPPTHIFPVIPTTKVSYWPMKK